MKRFIVLLTLLFACVELQGATVTAEANVDNGFSGASSGNLPVGSLIRVGTFDVSNLTISQNSANPGFLNAHFAEFGVAHIGDGGTPAGQFSKIIVNPNSNAQGFANKQIYLWAFNSTDNSSLGSSFSTAFEQGVFALDMTTPAAQNAAAFQWRFRDNGEIPDDSNVELSDLTNAAGTMLAPGALVLIGQFPFGISSSGAPNFGLMPIPEPTSSALSILGVVGLAVRRRRV